MRASSRHGFTLIELSIVLVIIGLVVGGVLVGRNLLEAASIRSQISQIEKYNTATNTFKLKYGGLPGDLLTTDANALGFFTFASPAAGRGDGNGAIGTDDSNASTYCRNEVLIFWRHLVEAKLIEGSYSANVGTNPGEIDSNGQVAVSPTTHQGINAYLPEAAIGRGASVIAGGTFSAALVMSRRANYFAISGINAMISTLGVFNGSTNPFTPQESYAIDVKIDNGAPDSGVVIATEGRNASDPRPGLIFTPPASCVTANAYVLNSTTPSCSLQIKFQ